MKACTFFFTLALVLMSFGSFVYAQDDVEAIDTTPTQFISFGDEVIDGTIKAPNLTLLRADQKVPFKRLLSLKKSFLPKLQDTTHSLK